MMIKINLTSKIMQKQQQQQRNFLLDNIYKYFLQLIID